MQGPANPSKVDLAKTFPSIKGWETQLGWHNWPSLRTLGGLTWPKLHIVETCQRLERMTPRKMYLTHYLWNEGGHILPWAQRPYRVGKVPIGLFFPPIYHQREAEHKKVSPRRIRVFLHCLDGTVGHGYGDGAHCAGHRHVWACRGAEALNCTHRTEREGATLSAM